MARWRYDMEVSVVQRLEVTVEADSRDEADRVAVQECRLHGEITDWSCRPSRKKLVTTAKRSVPVTSEEDPFLAEEVKR